MQTNLYFGPYNDPVDTSGHFHWEYPHDPDCHNSALTVDRSGLSIDIVLAVRNRPLADSPVDLIVQLYAAACGLFSAVTDVNQLVQQVLRNGDPNPLNNPLGISTFLQEWSQGGTIPANFPQYSSASDNPWTSGTVTWGVPAFSSSFILVATLSSATGQQGTATDGLYTQDPCVAVWLG